MPAMQLSAKDDRHRDGPRLWPAALFVPVIFLFCFRYLYWAPTHPYAGLAYLSDDLFYYLEVARNILATGRSTFDTLTLTNGYHPGWMLVLLGLGWLTGGYQVAFFLVFRLILVLLAVTAAGLLLARSRALIEEPLARAAFFLYAAYFVCKLTAPGMEIALTMPGMILMAQWGDRDPYTSTPTALRLGLVGAVTALSRIDSVMFVLPFLVFCMGVDPAGWRTRFWRCALAVSIVCAVAALYALSQWWWFGVAFPVSGLAKQLRVGFSPSADVLRSIFVPARFADLFDSLIPVVLCMVATLLLPFARCRRHVSLLQAWVFLHPLVYYAIVTFRYDWELDGWYHYPLPLATLTAGAFLWRVAVRELRMRVPRALLRAALAAVCLYIATSIYRTVRMSPDELACYPAAVDVSRFAREHPGIYGMGDRAGLAAFITEQPIIQLEGLVCDRELLESIRTEANLLDVLRARHVQYYVVTTPLERTDGCGRALEPLRPGPLAHKMQATICGAPLLERRFRYGTYLAIYAVPGA